MGAGGWEQSLWWGGQGEQTPLRPRGLASAAHCVSPTLPPLSCLLIWTQQPSPAGAMESEVTIEIDGWAVAISGILRQMCSGFSVLSLISPPCSLAQQGQRLVTSRELVTDTVQPWVCGTVYPGCLSSGRGSQGVPGAHNEEVAVQAHE